MSNMMVMEMIMPPPPPPPLASTEIAQSASTTVDCGTDSMSLPKTLLSQEKIQPVCSEWDKEEKNAIQKLFVESTAAISELNAAADQEEEKHVHVSTPQLSTKNYIQQRQQPPRPAPFPGVSPILPSLFLCSAAAARVNILEHLQINLVINMAPELIVDTPLPNPKPIYLRIPVLDKGHVDLKAFFDETCDLMEDVRQSNGKTLIHCVAGVSRSATICIAYLMKYEKMTLKDAYQHVKWARPLIRPNCSFFRQLMAYELELTGVQTVQMVFVESIGQEVPDVYEPEYRAMEQFYQRHRHRHVRKRD